MYTYDELKKYEYFNNIDLNYALDSLTAILSRGNILGFAKHLVENKTPFMMAILDIDNFKLVNDNYGHKVGDECLKSVASNLQKYVGDDGLVGRFGGDEFIFIYFKGTSYDEVHDYVEKLLNEGQIVRRKIKVLDKAFYVTATVGCASYPKDCDNYDDLFLIADKALYRGKTKGRNCFIVYVESKHKNIEVHRKEQSSLPNMFSRIFELSNNNKQTIDERIKRILNYVTDSLQISEAEFVKTDFTAIKSGEGFGCSIDSECIEIFEKLTQASNIYYPVGLNTGLDNKKLQTFIVDKKIITFILSKVIIDNETVGYILLFEGKISRIWQEKDLALLQYINAMIELMYLKNK